MRRIYRASRGCYRFGLAFAFLSSYIAMGMRVGVPGLGGEIKVIFHGDFASKWEVRCSDAEALVSLIPENGNEPQARKYPAKPSVLNDGEKPSA